MIIDALQALAVPIDSLNADRANARRHSEKNLRAIRASLAAYGQRTPVVVNRKGNIVEKGNGTLEAARALGWTEIAAVFVDDDAATQTGYAIADNRSGELAEWDEDVLARLLDSLEGDDFDLEDFGFDDRDLKQLGLADEPASEPEAHAASSDELHERWQILIECESEQQQAEWLERLTEEGVACRALIS